MDKEEKKETQEDDRFYAAKWNPFRPQPETLTSNDYIHHTKNLVWFWCGIAAVIAGIVLLIVSFLGIPRDSEAFVGLCSTGFTATVFGALAAIFSAFLYVREKRYKKSHDSHSDSPL